ncbi:MAG TPA: DUF4233 domain-containing protein [Actinomycetes bacterium]
MRGIAASVLVFEGLVVLFATLVAIDLGDVDDTVLWWVGGSASVACVLAAGLLRRPWGYAVGSALQVVVVAAGFVVPVMFFLGIVFAGLWFLALYLGRKVERLQ